MSQTVPCRVYRCARQPEMYLYLRADLAEDAVPEVLRQRTGRLTEVMSLELHAQRTLARVPVAGVMAALSERGYFVQFPPEGQIAAHLQDGD